MRLLELGLDRYGPFTDRRLIFRPDARLHVVFGPNEAGKSSALAAITDLFFGIPTRPTSDFVHPAKDLMLSARILGRDGRAFSFTRRKNKPQLSDGDGREFGPEALAGFLGGVGRDEFQKAFGLNADGLRRSGQDLRDTGGELGAALFSAAAGLRGLEGLRKALTAEAGALYVANGKARAFNVARSRYDDWRKAERASELGGEGLARLMAEIEAAKLRLADLARQRGALDAERARLARLRLARPPLVSMQRKRSELAALGDLPAVEVGFGARLTAALALAETTTAEAEATRARAARAAEEVARLTPDAGLLARGDAIADLVGEAAALRKAAADAPALATEAARLEAERGDLAARLGLADGAAIAARRPDDARLARLDRAVAEGTRLTEQCGRSSDERKRRGEELARQRAASAGLDVADPTALKDLFATVKPVLDRLAGVAEERARLAAELEAIAAAARRLDPSVDDLDRIAHAALPGREAMDAAAVAARAAGDRLRDAIRVEVEAREARLAAEATVVGFAAGEDLPTPERIAAARAERDALWQGLTAAWAAGRPLDAAAATFEAALRATDALADAAVREAGRVGDYRRALADRALATARHEATSAARQAAETETAAIGQAWQARWAPVGIVPAAPEAMRAWRATLDGLLEQRDRTRRRDAELAATLTEAAGVLPVLRRLAAELGLDAAAELPPTLVAGRVAEALTARERAYGKAREAEIQLGNLARLAAEAEAAEAEATAALAAWRQGVAADWGQLDLPVDAGLDEAAARLTAWRAVPGVLKALEALRRRQATQAEDERRFAAGVTRLVGEIGVDLDAREPARALAALEARLRTARDLAARRETASAHARDLADLEAAATEAATAAADTLARLVARIGPTEDVAAVAAALVARDALTADIARDAAELARVSDGADPDRLAEEVAALDADAVETRIGALEAESRQLQDQADATRLKLSQTEAAVAERGDVVTVEVAAQQRRMAEADLIETAETWLVLSLASALVGRAIEKKRGTDHGPMMARAGALFARLTGDAFAGLGQDYDDHDQPFLVGRRASGAAIAVEGMSEGTRDQLFLALRLAYLEDFARDAEPPPFVGDDLFASFDDRRTRNGLATLATIGAHVQPILFTHHGQVVDMARAELGTAVDIIAL